MNKRSWSGDNQRSQLQGFARLRAICWRRSLALFEWWSLRGEWWYGPVRRQLKAEFSGLDLDSPERVKQESDIFGETPILTVCKLLEIVATLADTKRETYVDLGCGRGQTCLVASCLGYQSLGLEKETDWVSRSSKVASLLQLQARFVAGDFMQHDWPQDALFFVVGTAYSQELKDAILQKIPDGSLVITGDWALSEGFKELWTGRLPVQWGVIPFAIYQKLNP